MGALIFLLLITTRRIQKQAQLEHIDTVVAQYEVPDPLPVIPELPPLPLTVPKTVQDDSDEPLAPLMMPLTKADVDWDKEQWELRQAERRAEFRKRLGDAEAAQAKLDQDWKRKIDESRSALETSRDALATMESSLSVLESNVTANRDHSASYAKQLAEAERQISEVKRFADAQQAERSKLANDAVGATQQIARAEDDLAKQVGATEIVAYDSMSGTARKPIVIECTEREIRFAAEGIALRPEELSGFPPEINPLRAGAEALMTYWGKSSENPDKPYILLVVRRAGTRAFYVARGLLTGMDHHFGYELVPEDMKLNWPKTDPQAIVECETAVRSLLAERERVVARIGRGMARADGPLDFADERGNFSLPDVASSQQSRNNLYLDEKWIPPAKRTFVERPALNENPSVEEPLPKLSSNRPTTERALEQRNGRPEDTEEAPQPFPTVLSRPISEAQSDRQHDGKDERGARSAKVDPWQLPSRRGDIGIERQIVMHLWPDRIGIDNEFEISIPDGVSAEFFQRMMTRAVRQYTDSWEQAPQSFFWKPTLKIVVHPGGNQHFSRIKKLSEQWDVSTRIEQAL